MSARGGDRRRRGRGGGHHHHPRPKRQASEQPDVDENSPVIQLFRSFQTELDTRHDKHERLVKLSRDITIDSKRAIFLLQRVAGTDGEKTLEEAEAKFEEIKKTKWRHVALELENEDSHQFTRAYSPGLQEYIEGVTFYYYLKHEKLIDWQTIQDELVFPKELPNQKSEPSDETADVSDKTADVPDKTADASGKTADAPDKTADAPDQSSPVDSVSNTTPLKDTAVSSSEISENTAEKVGESQGTVVVHVPPIEYMLGVADLTGELMRMAISAVGKGELEKPYKICDFMRVIYDAFLSYGNSARELSRKMSTLRQSLSKVENACYMLQVRGSEIPKHMLIDALTSSNATEFGGEMDGE